MNEPTLCRTAARSAAALLLALLLAAGLTSAAQAQAGDWTIECVDCPIYISQFNDGALRLDAAGRPHVAFGGDHLYYGWHDGLEWHFETVDDSPGVGSYASLALDAAGRPHISYYDEANDRPLYAYLDGAGWHIEQVHSRGGQRSSLALDAEGYPHIAFDRAYVTYKWKNADGWQWEELIPGGYLEIEDISLDLDSTGEPHIAYSLEEVSKPGYAYRDDTGWHYEHSLPAGEAGTDHVSLVLDSNDYPHIAYGATWEGSTVNYVYKDAAGWHGEAPDTGSRLGNYPSLQLDALDRPYLTYQGEEEMGLKHAYRDTDGWHVTTVDAEGNRSALALAGDGMGSVVYVANDSRELRYAVQEADGWRIEVLQAFGIAGEDPSLVLGGDGSLHLTYVRSMPTDQLIYAQRNQAGWHEEIVPTPPEEALGVGTALTLDPDRRPHIAYPLYDGLRYTYHDGAAWHTESVNGVATSGPSLALDSNGWPRVTYNDLSAKGIRYAYRDGGGWHIRTPSPDYVGTVAYPSLDIDAGDRTHMSYGSLTGSPNPTLYARPEATGWYTERIGEGSHFASLVLDDDDLPHVGYGDEPHYAYLDAGGWHTETVDHALSYYIELELDGSGKPHLAYVDYTRYYSNSIRYAWHTDTGWQTKAVWTAPNWLSNSWWECWYYDYLSLAVSPLGDVYIAFYDAWGRDLKLAYRPASLNQVYLPLVLRH